MTKKDVVGGKLFLSYPNEYAVLQSYKDNGFSRRGVLETGIKYPSELLNFFFPDEKEQTPANSTMTEDAQVPAKVDLPKLTPYFYDRNKLWWLWDNEECYWKMSDDIDILNMYEEIFPDDDIASPRTRQIVLNNMKQRGRKNMPEAAPKSWLQFKDKICDIETGKIFEATSKYFITNPLPYKIGLSEETPTIDKFFREWVIADGIQDETYVQTLYEVVAYSCCREQFLQTIVALTGAGSNGKGTFQNLVAKFLGEKNVCSSNLKALSTRNFEASALYKKLACFFGEVDSYDLTNTNLIKSLTGEDLIRYEFKGKTPFSEYSATTPIIATNSLPITPDKSIGFYRRWLIVDFVNQFQLKRDLLTQIPEEEFENLSLKIIRILRELYHRNEFTNQGTIEERRMRYEQRSHPLISFISENCEEGQGFIKLREFGEKFNLYLKNRRLRPYTIRKIGFLLREDGFETGARYFDKEKNDSAKAILNLSWAKDDEIKQGISKSGSSGSLDSQGSSQEKDGLPELPKSATPHNIPPTEDTPKEDPNLSDEQAKKFYSGIKEDAW